jgi:UPF0755 protein
MKWAALLLLIFFSTVVFLLLRPNSSKSGLLRVSRGSSTAQVANLLSRDFGMKSSWLFRKAAFFMGYRKPNPVKVQVEKGMSIFNIIRLLVKNKRQTVNIVIRSGWSREQLTNYLASKLEPDIQDINNAFGNTALLDSFGVNDTSVLSLFIPDTYNLYYSATAEEVLIRCAQKARAFWAKQGISSDSALRIYSLASIVEKESQKADERPIIAGVYLNRLRIGMKLQADPTVNFAIGAWRALYYKDLEVESPFNTYKYKGVPPGPICVASAQAIESVLHPSIHEYLFFVAKGDGSGYHRFSKTDSEHLRNVALRKKELSAR